MATELRIRCTNNKKKISLPFGSDLYDAFRLSGLEMQYGPVCAHVNNKVEGMSYRFYNNKDVRFFGLQSPTGMRTYVRTLFFVLAKAVEDLYPWAQLFIGVPMKGGYLCRLLMEPENLSAGSVESLYTTYYKLGNSIDYFYGCLLNRTGLLHLFDLIPFYDGLMLRVPKMSDPSQLEEMVEQTKMLDVVREHLHWQHILGVRTVGEFNAAIRAGYASELINVSEALQEKKLVDIVDQIVERKARMVLLAGPSSSGKTTTAKRVATLLMACGVRPRILSTDDYFVNRVDTPLDEHGEYDFECIEAVDTAFFNKQINQLLAGEEVELPRYDFPSGQRVFEGKKLSIGADDVIILEGNHALNPLFTRQIPDDKKFRIFVSPLTTVQLDDHNHIPTDDIRLLRRVIRDYKYRGYSALETIKRGPSVKAGEEKWILPFQEQADATFNSALLYELGVIRTQVLPILEQVPERAPEYAEAYRLTKFIHYFLPVPADQVPPTSLLREFAGGSSFRY